MEFYKATPHVYHAKNAAIRYFIAKDLIKPYERLSELYTLTHENYIKECTDYLNLPLDYAEGLFVQELQTLDTISKDNWWGFPLLGLEYHQYLKQLNTQFVIQNKEFTELRAKGGTESWVKMSNLLDLQQELKEACIGCLARKAFVEPSKETPTWDHCVRIGEGVWAELLDFQNNEYYKSNANFN